MTSRVPRALAGLSLLLALTALAAPAPRPGPTLKSGPRDAVIPRLEDVEREALLDRKRDESIDALKRIIPKIEDGTPQKADMYFQLSELYWEKSRFLYAKEMLAFFDAQKAADEKKNRGEKVPEPRQDHRQSELFRSETMRLYETVLREYPAYERKDEVLFNLAYNLYEVNRRPEALKRYEELLRSYPTSRFVADTHVQLGNHYFEVANDLPRARAQYEKAYASTNPRISSYALYKLAWCDFNVGAYEAALKKLQTTVEFAEKQDQKDRAFADLKNEALADSVRMFVQLDRADDAVAYFRAHAGKKRQATLTARLASGLQDAGHHDNAIKIYRLLLADAPTAEAAPEHQRAIIKSYEALRRRDQVRKEVGVLAELYRPGSTWWVANQSRPGALRAGFAVAEEALRTLVTEYHLEAQKTKQVETYRLARDVYKEYIDAFASSDDPQYVADQAFNLKFYYAEILWALEEWEPAAAQYDQVVTFVVPDRPEAREAANEKYRQQAAYNALLAYDKLVKIERGVLQKAELKAGQRVDEARKKGTVEKGGRLVKRSAREVVEKPLTRFEQALVAACDRYNQRFPRTADEVDIAYQAAVIYYSRDHVVEAARRFGEIILRHPEERRSQEAADLSMAILDEKEEWLQLNGLARQLLANTRLSRPGTDFTRRVASIVEGSQYKYIDEVVYKKENKPGAALRLFLAFVDEFPASENADRALTYATLIASEQKRLAEAAGLAERALAAYPKTIFDLKLTYTLSRLYEQLARYGDAARTAERFVQLYRLALPPEPGKAKAKPAPARGAKKAEPAAEGALSTIALSSIKDEDRRKEREALIAECNAPSDSWVQNAAFNAAYWYQGVGETDRAIAAATTYLSMFPAAKDAPAVWLQAAALRHERGELAEAMKQLEGFLTTYARDERVSDAMRLTVRHRMYRLAVAQKSAAEAERLAKDISQAYARLPEADRSLAVRDAAAHVRFASLEPTFQAYLDQKFRKLATFKRDLQAKEKRLAELEAGYAQVIAVGHPTHAIAALTRVGQLYADFAAQVSQMPDPPGLDEDQLALFRTELESRYVFPVEQKAAEALEKALAKAHELKVYGEWTTLAQDALNRYRPGLYGAAPRVEFRVAEPALATTLEPSLGELTAAQDRPAVPPTATRQEGTR